MIKVIGALAIAAVALVILVPTVFAQQGPEVQITSSMTRNDQPKIAIDSKDNVHLVYYDNCNSRYQVFGGSPNRYLVVEWNTNHLDEDEFGRFQAVLYESGTIDFNISLCTGTKTQISGVNQGPANGVSISGTPTDYSSYRFTWDSISDYNVATIPFNWMGFTSGTCVGANDDDSSGAVPIGFNFTFYGVQYNTVYVSSNGYMSFTDTSPLAFSPPAAFPSADASADNVIAPLWTDWYPEYSYRHIWYTMLDNNGNTLINDTPISQGAKYNKHPDIIVDSNDMVHIVWHDRAAYDFVYSKIDPSLDDQSGDSAHPGTIILVDGIPLMNMDDFTCHPRLAIDSQDCIHCVFEEDDNEVYYTKIDNNGNVLIPVVHIRPCTSWYGLPDLGMDSNDNLHITWADFQNTFADEVYYMMLDGSNGNILIDATMVSLDDGDKSKRACIVVDSLDMVHLIWQDHGSPVASNLSEPAELFYTKIDPYLDDQNGTSANVGTITLINPKMITANDVVKSRACQIGINCRNVHVTWYDGIKIVGGMNPHYMMLDVYGNILTADTPLSAAGGASFSSSNMDWMNALEVDSNNRAHMAWCDNRTGNYEIFYTYYQGGTPPACMPVGKSCDSVGNTQDLYTLGEDIYAVGSGFTPGVLVDIFVKPDLAWSDLDPAPPGVLNTGTTTIMTDGAGVIPPTLVWPGSLTIVGEYDIVFDESQDGLYDEWIDCVDNRHSPGFVIQGQYDYGDAPDLPYPTLITSTGASHIISGSPPVVYLGSNVDSDPDGQQNATATGDDDDGSDDEDGVSFPYGLSPGLVANVDVTANAACNLSAWIDFDGDGTWADVGEEIFTSQALAAGVNNLSFTVPAGATPLSTYARFRCTTAGTMTYTGLLPDGEVEDYQVNIVQPGTIILEKQTNPPGTPGTFTFIGDINGDLSHGQQIVISPAAPGTYSTQELIPPGWYIGVVSSSENIMPPNNSWDKNTGSFTFRLDPGETSHITVENVLFGSIGDRVWNDLNNDGIQDAGEPGIAGVTVNLYSGGTAPLATTVTNASGSYSFTNIQFGFYNLEYVLPPVYSFSPQDQGADDALDSDANSITGMTGVVSPDPGEFENTWDAGMWEFAVGATGDSADAGGVKKDSYTPDEIVYAIGSGFSPFGDVHIYVVPDHAWTDGDPIGPDISGDGMNVVAAGTTGDIGPIPIWDPPLDVGEYDIVFDANRDSFYNTPVGAAVDVVDDPNHPGFVVREPVAGGGGPTVGGQVMVVNKVQMISKLISLPMRLIVRFVL